MTDKDGGPTCKDCGCSAVRLPAELELWDYYAAAALQSLEWSEYELFEHLAHDAASVADAMLAERTKRGIDKQRGHVT